MHCAISMLTVMSAQRKQNLVRTVYLINCLCNNCAQQFCVVDDSVHIQSILGSKSISKFDRVGNT